MICIKYPNTESSFLCVHLENLLAAYVSQHDSVMNKHLNRDTKHCIPNTWFYVFLNLYFLKKKKEIEKVSLTNRNFLCHPV